MTYQKKLSSLHSLTKGERAGLREHGIRDRDFDKMSTREQHEWKEELKLDSYQQIRKLKIIK